MDNIRKNRAIVSTNHIDNHGDQISIEVLEQMVHLINDSQQRIRLGTDHRRDLPPKGRLENAVLRKDGDDYLVEADLCEFENIEPVDWDKTLLKESFLDSFQFVEVEKESCDGISISIDVENPLKVAPLIQSNLTPVKFFHSFILFILIFFVFFLSVMPGSTLNFVYKYNDSFLLLHLRSDSPKSSIRIA